MKVKDFKKATLGQLICIKDAEDCEIIYKAIAESEIKERCENVVR